VLIVSIKLILLNSFLFNDFFTFFYFRKNIKPFDTIAFMRKGIQMKCKVVKVEDGGVLVTYKVNGRAKLKALKFHMILNLEQQLGVCRRWMWPIVAVLFLTVAFVGFHISAVIIIYLYITMTQKFFANFFLMIGFNHRSTTHTLDKAQILTRFLRAL